MIDPAFVLPASGDVCFAPQIWAEASPSPLILNNFLQKQRLEVECSLQLQNERVRLGVQQQRNHQVAVLLNKASFLMRLKEDEMALARKRAVVLQEYLRRAEMESESWQRLAREKEAMIAELEKVKEAESCCGSSSGSTRMACKRCKARRSCVVFLPCRHLCSCKCCEGFLYSCPVCESVKEASMEVFLSC